MIDSEVLDFFARFCRVGEDVICKQFLLKSHTATGCILPRLLTRENVRQYSGIAFDNLKFSELAWSRKGILRPSPPISPLGMGGVRYKTKYSKAEQAVKRATKKKKEKAIRVKLKQIRTRRKLRKLSMTPEETFLFRIEKVVYLNLQSASSPRVSIFCFFQVPYFYAFNAVCLY